MAQDIVPIPPAPRWWVRISGQFQGLDRRDPAAWPAAPRLALLAMLAILIVAAAWFAMIRGVLEQLDAEQVEEARLKQDFQHKLPKAVHLAGLRKQKEEVLQQVTQLERQLPGRSEMDALLSDINQAGLARGLHFDLFRPGQASARAYYAELPIALKVSGRYHDIGAFAADVAALARIVTLHQLVITPGRDGMLVMEATVKTYRSLDPDEIAAQGKAKAAAAASSGGPR